MAFERVRFSALIAAAILLGVAATASAEVYVCTDANGRTITSDRPPRECGDLPVKELRPDGSVRRVILPPPTAAQRAAQAEQAKKEQQERERRRSQARRDIALMETYASEEEIETARQTALNSRAALIERAKRRLDNHARDRKRLDSEKEFYVNRKVPAKLERAFEVNEELIQTEHRVIADMQAEIERINERFDAELKRFRELSVAGVQPLQRRGVKTSAN